MVPLYSRRDASWHTLGCEKISATSGPFLSKSLRAFFSVNSTRMLSVLFSGLCSILSGTSSMFTSSISFPIDKLHILLVCMSDIGGPLFVVVIMRLALVKILDMTPDPISIHWWSFCSISAGSIFGPGCDLMSHPFGFGYLSATLSMGFGSAPWLILS